MRTLLFRLASVCAVTSLAACGGSGGTKSDSNPAPTTQYQIVSFGDSLSDVGTFAPIASAVGGGRFTTNPGQVWTQDVAQYFGDTLTAAYTIDATQKLSPAGGLGYAEGGATVATPAVDNDFLLDVIGDVEMPVTQQVSSFLQTYHTFKSNQIVLVWAGANDVLRAGGLPGGTAVVQSAADELATVVGEIVHGGATHVVVLNAPNVGLTPKGRTSADGGATYEQESQSFNSELVSALQAQGLANAVIQIDMYSWLNGVFANYQANGFLVSNTGQACSDALTPDDTSLLCSPATYVSSNADQTYMFADDLHPTTRLHSLIAQYVEQVLANNGLKP